MTRKTVFGALLCGATFIGGLLASDAAKDWPMWGGTMDRNMVSSMKGIPDKWDVATKENIRWTATLGSQSYGNPVVANGVVLVGTNNEGLRDPKQPGDRGVLLAFRESDELDACRQSSLARRPSTLPSGSHASRLEAATLWQ